MYFFADAGFEFNALDWRVVVAACVGISAAALAGWVSYQLVQRRHKARLANANRTSPESKPGVVANGSPRERRGSVRRRGGIVPIWITNEATTDEPEQGFVVDRSTGGLCIEVRERYRVGIVLSVRPSTQATSAPWTKIHVRHCYPRAGGWYLGAQYVSVPQPSVLRTFG